MFERMGGVPMIIPGNPVFLGNVTINGNLSVLGNFSFDSVNVQTAFFGDNDWILMGNTAAAPDAGISWNTAQTVDAWYFGLSAAQNTMIIAEYADRAYDFNHGAQTNPTLYIQSAAQSATQYIYFNHDQTNGVIGVGTGATSFPLLAGGRVYINGSSSLQTQTAGALDIDVTSLTASTSALNIATVNTAVTGNTAYGIYNTFTSTAVVTGTNQTLYGNYTTISKTGADTNANITAIYGTYSTATNTGSTDVGTKNTYGGYFSATGDTAGTAVAYGIYAVATGADTNWAGYFSGAVYVNNRIDITGTSSATIRYVSDGDVPLIMQGKWATNELVFGLTATAGNQFVLTTMLGTAVDHDHASQTNPTLFIHDATSADTTNNKWFSLAHDGTGGVITTGANIGAGTVPATIDNYLIIAPRGTESVRFLGTGSTTFTLPAAGVVTIDAATTTNTGVAGALDINFTSATTNAHGLDVLATATATTGKTLVGIYEQLTASTVLTGSNADFYGGAYYVTKTGADTSVDETNCTAILGNASQTGSTAAGTHNTYGGWFSATGDTAGTSTAYGIYATVSGADTNYAGYFNGALKVAGRELLTQGADVASATNLAVGTGGNVFELTGTTKVDLISNLGWGNGAIIVLIANENVTIDHGTATSGTNITILLSGAGDYNMTANDSLTLCLSETTAGGQAWREIARTAI